MQWVAAAVSPGWHGMLKRERRMLSPPRPLRLNSQMAALSATGRARETLKKAASGMKRNARGVQRPRHTEQIGEGATTQLRRTLSLAKPRLACRKAGVLEPTPRNASIRSRGNSFSVSPKGTEGEVND